MNMKNVHTYRRTFIFRSPYWIDGRSGTSDKAMGRVGEGRKVFLVSPPPNQWLCHSFQIINRSNMATDSGQESRASSSYRSCVDNSSLALQK